MARFLDDLTGPPEAGNFLGQRRRLYETPPGWHSESSKADYKPWTSNTQTLNIERRILMALRFVESKTSESQKPPKADKSRRKVLLFTAFF